MSSRAELVARKNRVLYIQLKLGVAVSVAHNPLLASVYLNWICRLADLPMIAP